MSDIDPPSSAALLKIQRANYHFRNLSKEIEVYLSKKPLRLFTRLDRTEVTETHSFEQVIPFPASLPLILGDAIHNLRSALDVKMFELIGTQAEQPKNVQFPFASSAEKFEKTIKQREVYLAGDNVVSLLSEIKPYPGGNDLLCGLHDLDIADKHRLILVITGTGTINSLDFEKMVPGIKGYASVNMILADGVKFIVQHKFRNRKERKLIWKHHPSDEYERATQPNLEVVFGENEAFANHPVITIVERLISEVTAVVHSLDRARQ